MGSNYSESDGMEKVGGAATMWSNMLPAAVGGAATMWSNILPAAVGDAKD